MLVFGFSKQTLADETTNWNGLRQWSRNRDVQTVSHAWAYDVTQTPLIGCFPKIIAAQLMKCTP